MRSFKRIAGLVLPALLASILVHAQTADEIVQKYLAAIGGKDKVASVTSVRSETSIDVMGNQNTGVTTVLVGKGFRNEIDLGGQKIIQVATDKGGWSINPMAGATEPEVMPADQYNIFKDMLYFSPFLDYATRGDKVEALGSEKFGDANALKVKYTNSAGKSTIYYFDPATYYITGIVTTARIMDQDMQQTITLKDYKKTDFGVVIPYTTNTDFGGQFQLAATLKKIEFNSAVDPGIFEMKK